MASMKMIAQCAILLAFICLVSAGNPHVGGLNDEREPDDEVKKVVQSVLKDIEEQAKEKYTSIEPLSYRKQVVAGANYFVKAAATKSNKENTYIHLRIYKPFRGPVQLTSMLKDVKKEKPLEHF